MKELDLMGFSQTIGQFAWMIVPWFWVIIANPDVFESQAVGVRQLSSLLVMCIILGILPAIFCRGIDASNMKIEKKLILKPYFQI